MLSWCVVTRSPRATIATPSLRWIMSKLNVLREVWLFLRSGRRWWLAPLLILLVVLGLLFVLAEGTALAPFIYTLF